MPRELPRTANYLPADQITGKVHTVPPMTFHHVEVDIVWQDGARSTHHGELQAWTETGEGDDRRMTACLVEWSDGSGTTGRTGCPRTPSAALEAGGAARVHARARCA